MRRRDVFAVLLGFLAGAAALAGGQEDDRELRRRLERLERAAARLLAGEGAGGADQAPPMGKGAHRLRFFPIADLCSGVPDHIPPDHYGAATEKPLFGAVSEEAPMPVGTSEELMELVRTRVWPGSYEEGANMAALRRAMVILNRKPALDDTDEFLNRLRTKVMRCVSVELEAVDLSRELYLALQADGAALSRARYEQLQAALADGTARRIFACHATGLDAQRFLVWHGRQLAALADFEFVGAGTGAGVDPQVEVVQAGGYLSVRPTLGDDPASVRLEVEGRLDELAGPIQARETAAGTLDEVPLRRAAARFSATVPARTWTVAGSGAVGEPTRVLLVRATPLARGGAR